MWKHGFLTLFCLGWLATGYNERDPWEGDDDSAGSPGDDDTGDDDSSEADDDTISDDDTGDDDTGAGAGIEYAYMAVHLDPDTPPADPSTGAVNETRASTYYPSMVELVELADVHGHELTLMFTPQWAVHTTSVACQVPADGDWDGQYEYLGVEYGTCLSLVQAFEANGHEIALHHHPLDAPAGWDGFTDAETWAADRDGDGVDETYFADGGGPSGPDPWYLGDLAAMMDLVNAIGAGGSVVSATTEEYPPGFLYQAAGGPAAYTDATSPGDLVSQPCAAEWDGLWVWQFRMRLYTSESTQNTVRLDELPDAMVDFEGSGEGPWTLGLVTHAKNVADTGAPQYSALFEDLATLGLTLETVVSAMGQYATTATDPAQADPTLLCP